MNIKWHNPYLLLLQLICFVSFSQSTTHADYVNPFIGTGGTGHTFPGAVVPFGMVQLSPDTRIDGSWEGCGGYYYNDSIIYGFSHTHLSGTGVSDYGDILVMPTLDAKNFKNKTYSSKYSHLKEKASAGFYQVQLENNINVQLTATQRVGVHHYTFPNTDTSSIVIDLLHRDKTLKCTFKILDSVTAVGYRLSEGWAQQQYVYFVMKFNKPIISKKLNTIETLQKNQMMMKKQLQHYYSLITQIKYLLL